MAGLSELEEINLLILLKLSYNEIMNVCQTNKLYSQLCLNEHFWKMKVDQDYPGASQYKPKEITYHQQYQDLMKHLMMEEMVDMGRIDLLTRVADWWFKDRIYLASRAASYGYLDLVKWLAEKHNLYPDQDNLERIAENSTFEVLKWLDSQGYRFGQNEANAAARSGKLDVLRWLADKGILPIPGAIGAAAADNKINVLDWAVERGILPEQIGIDVAAMNGHLEVLNWARKHDIPLSSENLKYVHTKLDHDYSLWLYQKGVLTNQDGADLMAVNGHLDILKYLAAEGILPSQQGVQNAAYRSQHEVIEWLEQFGLKPERYVKPDRGLYGWVSKLWSWTM